MALNKSNRRKKVTRKSKRVINKTSFKKRVQKIIDSQSEHKIYVIQGNNNTITTASGGGTPAALNVMPQLSLGTNQEARVGEQVKIVSAKVHGFVNLLPYNALSNTGPAPTKLKIWLVSSKLTNSSTFGSTAVGTGFFEIGSDTVGFQGNLSDMLLPVNQQGWTVYGSKTFNLGYTYASATGGANTASYFDNSRFSLPFSFDFGKHFKKPLRYSDDSSSLNNNFPYDRNCWLIFQAVYADGTSTAGLATAEYHHMLQIKYSDM